MITGVINRWIGEKGFGFVTESMAPGRSLFVHVSQIETPDPEPPAVGNVVEFDVSEGPRGLRATRARIISRASRDR